MLNSEIVHAAQKFNVRNLLVIAYGGRYNNNLIISILSKYSDVQTVRSMTYLIEKHPDLFSNEQINSLLFGAACHNNTSMIKLALQKGANINGNCNSIPIFAASMDGSVESVKFLIEKGVDLFKNSYCGNTALSYAFQENFRDKNKKKDSIEIAYAILSTISPQERKKIRSEIKGLVAVYFSAFPKPPREIRKIITKHLINLLVRDHMKGADQLIDHAYIKLDSWRPPIPRFKDPPHLLNITSLRKPHHWKNIELLVQQNIRRILFADPKIEEDEQEKQDVKDGQEKQDVKDEQEEQEEEDGQEEENDTNMRDISESEWTMFEDID